MYDNIDTAEDRTAWVTLLHDCRRM